jgi:hypothetical protein
VTSAGRRFDPPPTPPIGWLNLAIRKRRPRLRRIGKMLAVDNSVYTQVDRGNPLRKVGRIQRSAFGVGSGKRSDPSTPGANHRQMGAEPRGGIIDVQGCCRMLGLGVVLTPGSRPRLVLQMSGNSEGRVANRPRPAGRPLGTG